MTEDNKDISAEFKSGIGATAINTEGRKRVKLRLNFSTLKNIETPVKALGEYSKSSDDTRYIFVNKVQAYRAKTESSTDENSKDKSESLDIAINSGSAPATVIGSVTDLALDSASSKTSLKNKSNFKNKFILKKGIKIKSEPKPKDNIKNTSAKKTAAKDTATKQSTALKADSKQPKTLSQSKISLTVNGIEQGIKTAFTKYSKSNNITYHETLKRLWRLFELCPITLEGMESLEKAYELEGNKCLEKLSNTLVDTAKSMIGSYMLKHVNHPLIIASKNRAAAIVQELMNKNRDAKNWYNKVFISRNFVHSSYMIQKRLESPSFVGVGEKAIANYLKDNKAMIDAHHLEYGLDEGHNRKAVTYLRNLQRKEDTADLSATIDAKISNDTSFEKTEDKIKGRKAFKRNLVNRNHQNY